MERVDIVLLGAEAVVESGGVVSAMGSYGIAIAAHVHKIPFYIICESFKASFKPSYFNTLNQWFFKPLKCRSYLAICLKT